MENITTSSVQFPIGSGHGSGFLASPAGDRPRPGLLVIQEWWGMNDHIKDITSRLANEGFAALAVDMYDGKVTKDPDEAKGIMMDMDKAAAMEKLNAAVAYMKTKPGVSRVGVIGFCMGGYFSLALACNNKNIGAAAPFYGSVPPDAVLGNLNAPTIYFYGEKDHHIASSEIDRLERLMKSAGKTGEVIRYPESDHAFFNDTRKEVYNPKDSKDAWTRALAFLRKHLA
ncbi:MAG TPA: dienelactone hydrolase family protein [Terriglobia bacterium]|nr:dienelactone hydrolase family protein [Terriglobia bacterium]